MVVAALVRMGARITKRVKWSITDNIFTILGDCIRRDRWLLAETAVLLVRDLSVTAVGGEEFYDAGRLHNRCSETEGLLAWWATNNSRELDRTLL